MAIVNLADVAARAAPVRPYRRAHGYGEAEAPPPESRGRMAFWDLVITGAVTGATIWAVHRTLNRSFPSR